MRAHLKKFQSFCGLMSGTFGVSLEVPKIAGDSDEARLSVVKKFCGEFLEHPVGHLWHEPTKRMSSRTRMSIRMSLFLYRKALPSVEPDVRAYVDKMSGEGPPPDPGFLEYVRRQVPRLFPPRWDRTLYPQACLSCTVPVKSCLQLGSKEGGSRLAVMRKYGVSPDGAHHSYVMDLLSRESPIMLSPSRVTSVETGGKHRVISVGDVDLNLFRPLHSSIYNRLSTFPWLLRGKEKPTSFKEFTQRPGEFFVSGDYESATDNLNSEVQQTMLSLILDNSCAVPKGILESAGSTLSMMMYVRGADGSPEPAVRQRRGQLMGNLLSFPLLCLVNYLAFRYYTKTKFSRDGVPVRVNGDDIVFRSTPEVYRRWFDGVVGSGLVLSKGKTMVHSTFFSLNSSLFMSRRDRVKGVPFLRSTAFGYSARDGGVESLRGRFDSFCPFFTGRRKEYLRVQWLKWNRNWIVASRRSLSRGLGLNVNESEVRSAGLWTRECFYLSMAKETMLPVKRSTLDQVLRVPPDWVPRRVDRITKEMKKEMTGLAGAFVECAWSEVRGIFNDSDFRDRVDDSPNWTGEQRGLRRRARLLGLSPRNAGRFLKCKLTRTLESYWRQVRVTVWRPAASGGCPAQDNDSDEGYVVRRWWTRPLTFSAGSG
jgi:hypothetical protein